MSALAGGSTSPDASARVEIVDLLARYGRALDDRDFEAVASCFTEDARVTYSGTRLEPGRAAIVAHLQGLRTLVASTHVMGLPVIDLDGDVARVETAGLAHLVTPTEHGIVVRTRGLRYRDVAVRRDGRWMIAERVHRCDWMYETPAAPTSVVRPADG